MVDRADINNVLMQMRAIQSQAQGGAGITAAAPVAPNQAELKTDRTGFGDLLKHAVDSVNEVQGTAKNLATAYEKGDPTVDLPQVMIAAQKASVSFQAMTQVRNRLVSAYEDIMKMPI
ncbi:flagellar hook-basal body complex protein FliE [Pontibacterium sp.]|uniref:flagellar hook-basal body complex protein FliE n=1 Tax=Pontibacterium sp. TaxID=2036026 RepID=UPI003567C77B